MKGIFTVLVENKAGVLSHIAGLFARRGFNIDSLAVGETEDKTTSSMTIISELLMIKVAYTNATRSDIMQICNITGAHIADLAPKTMVIELTAKTSKVDRFIKLMQPFGIVEMIRTGAVALQREID